MRKKYKADLTDTQWDEIQPFGMRNRKWLLQPTKQAVHKVRYKNFVLSKNFYRTSQSLEVEISQKITPLANDKSALGSGKNFCLA